MVLLIPGGPVGCFGFKSGNAGSQPLRVDLLNGRIIISGDFSDNPVIIHNKPFWPVQVLSAKVPNEVYTRSEERSG